MEERKSNGNADRFETLFGDGFAHGACQSSMTRPGTRLNSATLCVTSVQPFARGMAAICMSLPPINNPRAVRSARILGSCPFCDDKAEKRREFRICRHALMKWQMRECKEKQHYQQKSASQNGRLRYWRNV